MKLKLKKTRGRPSKEKKILLTDIQMQALKKFGQVKVKGYIVYETT